MAATNNRLNSLQAGRGLASLAVVIHHANLATSSFATPLPCAALFQQGYLGVDFFFVLSGFIISHATVGRGKTLGDYALARIRRVYPPYLPVGIGLALIYAFAPHLSASDHEWSWLPTLTLLPVASGTALSVAWTLKHEIMFYFIFGALYFSNRLALGLSVWAVAIVTAALMRVTGIVPLSILNLEFLMGVAVASLYRRGCGHPVLYLLALPPLVLWLVLGATRENSVLVGIAFAITILATVDRERSGRLQVPAWLTFLGAASYSTYLIHGLVISVTARLIGGANAWLLFGTCVAASVAGGIAYYWVLERRTLAWQLRSRTCHSSPRSDWRR